MADPKQVADFFDNLAHTWAERAYDSKDTVAKFPSSKVRHHIMLDEIARRVPSGAALDMGCASGELVIDLLKKGYDVRGFDISPEMIRLASKKIAADSSLTHIDPNAVLSVQDFYSFSSASSFDVVSAMGFTEYLSSDEIFFEKVSGLLVDGGYLITDFRNLLFSLFSANSYTKSLFESDIAPHVLTEFQTIEKYSPTVSKDVPASIFAAYEDMYKNLQHIQSHEHTPRTTELQLINTQIDLRQSAPWIVEKEAKKYGLTLEYVVYFHLHPFPPIFEKQFPVLFNTIGLAMQPLGYTPLGATLSSSFVGIFRKG